MTIIHLRNISISKLESFLELCGCKFIKNKKGHIQYTRSDLTRPLVFQNHIDPVPEFIVQNLLRGLGYSKKEFHQIISGEIIVKRETSKKYILKSIK